MNRVIDSSFQRSERLFALTAQHIGAGFDLYLQIFHVLALIGVPLCDVLYYFSLILIAGWHTYFRRDPETTTTAAITNCNWCYLYWLNDYKRGLEAVLMNYFYCRYWKSLRRGPKASYYWFSTRTRDYVQSHCSSARPSSSCSCALFADLQRSRRTHPLHFL